MSVNYTVRSVIGVFATMIAAMLLGASATASTPAPHAANARPKQVLLLTHNLFYNHDNLATIEKVLPEWGKAAGFVVTSPAGYKQTAECVRERPCDPGVLDLSMIDRRYLARFDAIVMSTNGELPFTDAGKQALVDFVRQGKGILFLHQSAVTLYGFKPWGEMLGGYIGTLQPFDTMNAVRRPAVLKVEDPHHPATRMLPEHWILNDEFHRFVTRAWDPAHSNESLGPTRLPIPLGFSRDRVTVVLSMDAERTNFAGAPAGWDRSGDYPIAWYQHYGKGRTFYTALGHRNDLWTGDALFKAHVLGALRWVLRLEN